MPSSQRRKSESSSSTQTGKEVFFYLIVVFIALVFCLEIALFNDAGTNTVEIRMLDIASNFMAPRNVDNGREVTSRLVEPTNDDGNYKIDLPPHLLPHPPILPLFNSIPNAEDHIKSVLDGRPTMLGVIALMQKFISELHDSNMKDRESDGQTLLDNFFRITNKHVKPFHDAYKGRTIFPVREDDSIYISLAAFREFFLVETLESAFKNAKHPEKLFVGAVVQNCFGAIRDDGTIDTSGTPCKSGKQKVGVDKNGNDIRKSFDIGVDKNGIEAFCALPDYKKYCDNGQVRVLYQHHFDGQGPSMARFYASKLWGGETFFLQIDSHLRFAHEWDAKFIADTKLTLNYPKSVMSSYPPGFDQIRFIPKKMRVALKGKIDNNTVVESPGCRLCHCGTPPGINPMIHIAQSKSYRGNETRPTQIPFIGAGLVFAHGSFLKDVPFDPYLPYTFMGEEILLAMRLWTNGWNIHAPRKNLVIHQYRPGKLGLPKFYMSIAGM